MATQSSLNINQLLAKSSSPTFAGITISGVTTMSGGQVWKYTSPGAYPYTALSSDVIIGVDTNSARTIKLPDAPANGTIYILKDVVGLLATNNVSVTTVSGSVTIDGLTTYIMSANNYLSRGFFFNGSNYFVF